ncbi:MAG: sel1 repeat family protein, partial [Thermoguttaceae bacterium]|nr:sel1 repeat family protein [Thermoguttaceae bacterium]
MSSNSNKRDSAQPAETPSFQTPVLSADTKRLQEPSELGDVDSLYKLSLLYQFEVERNPAEAERLLRRDDELDDAEITFKLAVIYEIGCNVDPDPVKAVQLYRQAAEKEHVEA